MFDLVLVLDKFCETSHLGRDKTPGARQLGADNSVRDNSARTIRRATIRRGFVLRAVLGLELDVAGLGLILGFFGTSAQRSTSWRAWPSVD